MEKNQRAKSDIMAEGVGFEPTVQQAVHLISSQARSTTPASLRERIYQQVSRAATLFVNSSPAGPGTDCMSVPSQGDPAAA